MASVDPGADVDVIEMNKDIQVTNFSLYEKTQKKSAYFKIKAYGLSQVYRVSVIPCGELQSDEYVSVIILKVRKDSDPEPGLIKNDLSWTLSIVDASGSGNYYQSIVKEDFVFAPLMIEVPEFFKRSILLEQSMEFLPGDVLTVRCELSCISYKGPSVQKEQNEKQDIPIRTFDLLLLPTASYIRRILDQDTAAVVIRNDGLCRVERDLGDVLVAVLDTLRTTFKCRSPRADSAYLESIRDWLAATDAADEIRETYLGFNPVFRRYTRLKENLRQTLSNPRVLCETALRRDNVHLKRLNSITKTMEKHMKTSYTRFAIGERDDIHPKYVRCFAWSPESHFGMHPDAHQRHSHETDFAQLSSLQDNDYYRTVKGCVCFMEEAVKYLLPGRADHQTGECPPGGAGNRWQFLVETMDGVPFSISFEDGLETLGSKMIAASPFFESMLKHPLREKLQKRVRLAEINYNTFINFLHYLQTGQRKFDSLYELIDLYEFATKYCVEELKRSCADEMVPFFTHDNIDHIEKIVLYYEDEYALELVETYINEIIPRLASGRKEPKPGLNETKWMTKQDEIVTGSFYHQEEDGEREFDFYK